MIPKTTYILILLILSILGIQPSYADNDKIPHDKISGSHSISVRNIPSLDKLPLTAIHRIFQDSEGFMWYGTFDGICRYDGYNVKTFRSDLNHPGMLRNNYISYIVEDHEGKIWIGTMEGLYFLDKKDYSINHVDLGKDDSKNIFTLSVTNDGSIWASVPGTLYQLNPRGKVIHSFSTSEGKNERCAYFVYDMPDGKTITSLNSDRMFELEFKNHTLKPYFQSSEIKDIERILHDKRNNCYWLGTWGSGIVRFNPAATTPDSIYLIQPTAKDALGNPVRNYFHMVKDDNLGYIWATTERDLFAFETKDGKILSPVSLEGIFPDGNKFYYEIFKDRDGSLWVSSFDNPSIVIDFTPGEIKYENFDIFRNDYRNTPMLLSMTVGADGTQWFCQDGYGLFMNTPDGKLIHYPPNLGNLGLWRLPKLSNGSKGTIWATTLGYNVVNLAREGDTMRHIRTVDLSKDTPSFKTVNAVYEDSHGILWAATNNGLIAHDLQNDTSSQVRGIGGNITAITELADGSIWAVGEKPGIYRIGDNMRAYILKTSQSFNNIVPTSDGTLWLSTAGGDIFSFSPSRKLLTRHTKKAGLRGESINDMIIDRFNHVWIIGNQFVREYNPRNGAYRTYTTWHEKFPLMRFTKNSSSLTPQGDVSVGGIGGIVTLPATQALEGMPRNIETYITDVIASGESKLSDGVEKSDGRLSVRLKPEDDHIEIQFSTLHYKYPDQIRYAYRMPGEDRDWVYTGQRRNSAFYNHIDAGNHTFEVKATDSNGLWSDKTTTLSIYREPFWYETWWAKLILCVAAILVGWLAISYYSKSRHQKLLRQRLQELLDNRVTNDSMQTASPHNDTTDSKPSKPALSAISIQTADHDLLQRAVDCVERRLGDENFDVMTFASDMNMSKATLTRKLKGVAGQSPAEFVREIRMRHAAKMLSNPDISVSEVANAVGYSDSRHFASLFKATFGMPPTQYQTSNAMKTDHDCTQE